MANLTICVTVDWEGEYLKELDLEAMTAFRNEFNGMPLTHFICPAYLTRGGNLKPVIENICRQIIEGLDKVGLHVHCWESLVRAAGVQPIADAPSWYMQGHGPEAPISGSNRKDTGHGVPLGLYTTQNIQNIIQFAGNLLNTHGIAPEVPTIFRCGGWMSSDCVQTALQTLRYIGDSSATDAPYFRLIDHTLKGIDCELGAWLAKLWGESLIETPIYLSNKQSQKVMPSGCDEKSQPYSISNVLQVADNSVLADYLTAQMIYDRLHAAWVRAAEYDCVHVCGFHQDSATRGNIFDFRRDNPVSNLDNFASALALFLDDLGLVQRLNFNRDQIARDVTIQLKDSSRVQKADAGHNVCFNTVGGVAGEEQPSEEFRYISPRSDERQRRRDLAAMRAASPHDQTPRSLG